MTPNQTIGTFLGTWLAIFTWACIKSDDSTGEDDFFFSGFFAAWITAALWFLTN